jgi:hypothetical protein
MRAREFVVEKIIGRARTGNLTIHIDDHAVEQTYFKDADYRAVDRAVFKLKHIESQLATLEPNEPSWVLDPDSGISLGIRSLGKPNHYVLGTVHPDRTYQSDVADFVLPSGAPSKQELAELSFLGSPCTQDCSGHRAGYRWYKKTQQDPQSWSPSFNKGAALARAGK